MRSTAKSSRSGTRNETGRVRLILKLTSFVTDGYPNLGNSAGLKPPAFECLDGEFVQYGIASAFEHARVSHRAVRGINSYYASTASGKVAPFHFVRVIR